MRRPPRAARNLAEGGPRRTREAMGSDVHDRQRGGRADILTSPGFLAGLALLLANDFALKPLFHNHLTGKLSDFAGLFVFPLFWSALFPRLRRAAHPLTAALFVFWKSPASQPLIDAWNSLGPLPLARTVDATDLLALAALPLSFLYEERRGAAHARGPAPYLVAVASVFAFTATSYSTEYPYDNRYTFPDSKVELARKLYHLTHVDSRYRVSGCSAPGQTPGEISVSIPSDFCFDSVDATVRLEGTEGGSVLALAKMKHDCPEGRGDKQKLLAVFEKEFIEKVRRVSFGEPSGETGEVTTRAPEPQPRRKGRIYFVSVGDLPGVSVDD